MDRSKRLYIARKLSITTVSEEKIYNSEMFDLDHTTPGSASISCRALLE